MKIKALLLSWKLWMFLLIVQLLCSAQQQTGTEGRSPQSARNNALPDTTKDGIVYLFEMREKDGEPKMIAKPVLRITKRAFREARDIGADYILIHMSTYGGQVNVADEIRTEILNSDIPVIVFVDNQAISAGALIAIAADSIYMRPGASIGASTVVNQTGEVVPDKYQSFMRSTMRATAESHGKRPKIVNGDTTWVWHRDPRIAEAMVDPNLEVAGISDSGQVLTMTVEEAIPVGYCEGKANSIDEVLELAGLSEYRVIKHQENWMEKIILFLLNPIVQSILILLIIGGIYFELQTPGIGFPLGLAVVAALLYFAPSYMDGLAENWEILLFLIGIGLLALEIFVIPGFGVAGITGIMLILASLTLGVFDNFKFELDVKDALSEIALIFGRILLTVLVSIGLSLWISRLIGTTGFFKGIALDKNQNTAEGYISIDMHQKEMVGKTGVAWTVLRPSGRIKIGDEIFDAKAEIGYIEKGDKVKVIRDEAGQLYVIKI